MKYFIVLFTTCLLLIACWRKGKKSMTLWLLQCNFIMEETNCDVCWLVMKSTKPKPRGEVSLLCSPSQWGTSEIRQMVEMTFEKITISQFRLREEGKQEKGVGYFYMARDKSGFPNCASVRPIRLPILRMLSAPFTQATFICLCLGRSRKGGV